METEYLTREVWELQIKNIVDENNRQNHRIAKLEEDVKAMQDVKIMLGKITVDMEYMKNEIKAMRSDMENVKGIPASRWDKLMSGLIGAAATVIGGGVIAAAIHFL